ncbi:MAG: hypothetical protein NWF07_13105 [Candidatus Bathyarchaeota archaeon]|nr:hypothetical protein [Candidatus Bathyarchaeota archaeon]
MIWILKVVVFYCFVLVNLICCVGCFCFMASSDYLEMHIEKVLGFEDHFGLRFCDKGLLLAALDRSGFGSERKKCLAVAGDALLDFVLFNFLLDRGGYSKGMMDGIRGSLNTDDNLAVIGREMELGEFIVFPDSATEVERVSGDAYYNDTLEALVYIVMKDMGLETATRFVAEHIISRLEIE